ncbi:MAG: tetratricopeptide repeat protein [Acidobacteria bacterium]|nr:tetratricopeptide repeat protein [Acidobacteriota bacterium]
MKKHKTSPDPQPVQSAGLPWWLAPALALAALIAYLPALNGPFLFDDLSLPMLNPANALTVSGYLTRGVRALSNISLLADRSLWELNTFPYHLQNLLLHLASTLLLFLVVRSLVERLVRERAPVAAAFAAAVFLLHPLQTEAVSYIASRSEVMQVFFALLAYWLFLGTGTQAMGWGRAAAVLGALGLGVLSKEPAVAMVAVFLFTDYLLDPDGSLRRIRANWRLYAPLAVAAVAGGAFIYRIASREGTAGIGIGVSPTDYLCTQFQTIWVYLRLFILPWGQNLDHAFPVVKAPGTALSWAGLAGIVLLLAGAWVGRRKYPLAALGIFAFLVLLTPTSSIIAIADMLVERRVYLPSLGLALVLAEIVIRLKPARGQFAWLSVIVLALAGLTMSRNNVYASTTAMWKSAVDANPANYRAQFQLAYSYYEQGRCTEASDHYGAAAQLRKPDYRMLVDWSLALECAGNAEMALEKLQQATKLERNPHAWSQIGMIYGKRHQLDNAMEALNQALAIDPRNETALVYRGNVRVMQGQPSAALADFDLVLAMNPSNQMALQGRTAALQAGAVAK